MKNWVKDTLLSVVLIVISIATYVVAKEYPDIASHFPTRLAWVLGGLAVALLVKSLFVTRVKNAQETTDLSSIKGVFVVVAAIAVYTLILKYAGYLVSSFCLLLFLMPFLGFTRKVALILTTAGCVLVVYGAFKLILGVPLPPGLFFQG
jgi:proteasome assembly chaperone (PAC2) family protein